MATQTKDITLLTSSNVTRANVLEKLSAICNRAQKMTVSYFSIVVMECQVQYVAMMLPFRMKIL